MTWTMGLGNSGPHSTLLFSHNDYKLSLLDTGAPDQIMNVAVTGPMYHVLALV